MELTMAQRREEGPRVSPRAGVCSGPKPVALGRGRASVPPRQVLASATTTRKRGSRG